MNNKTILIFGGSKGIGRVFAQRRIEQGDNVYVFSRSWEKRESNEPQFIKMNFCNKDEVKNKLLILLNEVKSIDSIVFTQRYRGDEDNWSSEISASTELFKDVLELSFDYLKEHATIVAISSNASKLIAVEQPISYHAAKAALEQMVRYYAIKLASKKIRVNAVSPAITLKPENIDFYNKEKNIKKMFESVIPLGRMCNSEDVCNVIDFLLGEQSFFITGQTIIVDGGLSLMTPETFLRKALLGLEIWKSY